LIDVATAVMAIDASAPEWTSAASGRSYQLAACRSALGPD